jgi:hypothetical protein
MIPSQITKLAEIIREYEGWYEGSNSWRCNNPGNCKYTQIYRSIYGKVRKSPRGFAIFKSKELGWLYLQNLLWNWAEKEKRNYTILQLMREYAPTCDDNNPEEYAKFITRRMGVSADTKLRELI